MPRATASLGTGQSFDIAEVGPAPRALICLDNAAHREACQEIMPALGYHTIHTPSQQAQALAYLSQVPYECFILDVTFDGSTLEANPILACLHELPMERRRYMFATLCVPPDVITADAMTAYSQSVNLIIEQADLPSCRRLLEQHVTEHKRLYRVYRELRQQLGKDV
jgi:CheY-like chemotaxis protein